MPTTIKYQNDAESFITEEEANQLNDYSKLFYEDGALKKEETYKDGVLWGGVYRLGSSEDPITVVKQLGPHLMWSIGSNKQLVNGYTIWEYRFYTETLALKPTFSKIAYDSKLRVVGVISYDTATLQVKSGLKTFYFGGVLVEGETNSYYEEDSEINFNFDSTTLSQIFMNSEIINNEGSFDTLNSFVQEAGTLIDYLFTPAQLDYYSNLEPLAPPFSCSKKR